MAFPVDLWTDDEEDDPALLEESEFEEIPELTEESDFDEEMDTVNVVRGDNTSILSTTLWSIFSYMCPQIFFFMLLSIPRIYFESVRYKRPVYDVTDYSKFPEWELHC